MIVDEEALTVLRSKYALPPCPSMARGVLCECHPKTFTLKACVWQGYKEARDMFPALAETVEKLWKVARAAERMIEDSKHMREEYSDMEAATDEATEALAALKEPAQ